MMILRWITIFYGCCFIVLASCGSKKEFVITDDYVTRESGGKASSGETAKLSDTDRKHLAVKLGVMPAEISNDKLYTYIKSTEGKPWSSATVADGVYTHVYGKKLAGSPTDMMADRRLELFKSTASLREGDLVFFRTSSNEVVTHVGVYLKNNRFFSSQGKAAIYNLKKGQWKKNFVTAGRMKQ